MILVLKLLNSRTWMTLQSSKVIFQALETSAASLTSVFSATSLASTASTAFFSQKTSWSWLFDHTCQLPPKWPTQVPFCGLDHQNSNFSLTFAWYPFCRRLLRPAFVIFLKVGWWNSNAQTSGTHWYLHYNLKVIFRMSPTPSKYIKAGRMTL